MSKTKNHLKEEKHESRNKLTDEVLNNSFKKRFSELTKDIETRKDLAEHLGVTVTAIGQYAEGPTFPKTSNLIRIAQFFGCSLDYLIGQSDVFSPNAEIQAICEYTGLSEAAVKVLHFINLPPENMKESDAAFNNKTLQMLNLILENEAKDIVGPQNEVFFKNVFTDMYNYIHVKDTKVTYLGHDDGSIPEYYNSHVLMQEMCISNIRKQLEHLS